MVSFIFALLFLAIAIGTVIVRKTYYAVPLKELKRQAKARNMPAAVLYDAVAYGASLRLLLWAVIGLSSAAGIILLARTAPFVVALVLVTAVLWAAFSWLPASRVSGPGTKMTVAITPSVVWILRTAYPLLRRVADRAEKKVKVHQHTGVFERDDLVALVQQQAEQDDSRLTIEELAIVQRALSFGDHLVRSVLTNRKQVQIIGTNDTVGPVLIDELHKTGAPFVLVQDEQKELVGVLVVARLGLHSGGLVRDHMVPRVYYIHESDSLREALHAFFVTNSPVLVVINSHEEYVGIITIESIVRQLLGHLPGEDFEQYADKSLVAARHTQSPQ